LNPTGTALDYSTFVAATGSDLTASVAVDRSGSVYVTGSAVSSDFPTTQDAYEPNLTGKSNASVSKLDPAGSSLLYSTFLGGTGSDAGNSVGMDGDGNAYVTGAATSRDFPTSPELSRARSKAAALARTTYLSRS